MKILIHSNGPHVQTGYGVQCRYLVERLQAAGHDVAVSCTYGQQGSIGSWHGVKLYPVGYEVNGNDVLHQHAYHHFDRDITAGWIITLLDVWCLVSPRLADFNIAAWVPVDHDPAPPDVMRFFHRTDAVPVAMAKFGRDKLAEQGLDPSYIPLAVDTKVFRPSPTVKIGDRVVTGREMLGVDENAFLVGMVAMNKGQFRDRKGFNEALRAFGQFWRNHQDAVLYIHADWPGGAEGLNLKTLAMHAAVPEHALVFPDLYAYKFGFNPEQMAAMYSAFDVLLSPSHGEGFCVPLIEAQACGTPVIATGFSAQKELIGAGWSVAGQLEWDPSQESSYVTPYIVDVVDKLELAYAADLSGLAKAAVSFAADYDADVVFDRYWVPFLASLERQAEPVPLARPHMEDVAVLVPVLNRPENVAPLVESFNATNDGHATLYFIADADDIAEREAVEAAGGKIIDATRGSTYAQKVNAGVEHTAEGWLFVTGDDVRFHDGWIQQARLLSDRFDVIGTNDTAGEVKNPDVAAGRHADHFFVRRAYVDEYGACLDGPGVLAPEVYRHWWVDKEIVGLAKARNVFSPCLTSIVEHLHPGYDGGERDATHMLAIESADADAKTFRSRLPLIELHRTSRAKVT